MSCKKAPADREFRNLSGNVVECASASLQESYRLKERRKAGLVPAREQERAASNSLASDSVAPKTRQKTALGSTASEAKEAAL